MMHKTRTTYTLPAAELNALMLATEETLAVTRKEFEQLCETVNADPYVLKEMDRLRRVIDNGVHTLNTIRAIQDRQREEVA